jgi:hypothetical protein
MAVDDFKIIDILSTDLSGNVILTISDHLDWVESAQHQATLQEKLNRYLAFVESCEILDSYPDAKGRRIVFRVVTQHEPDASGFEFLGQARKIIERAGFEFQHVTRSVA